MFTAFRTSLICKKCVSDIEQLLYILYCAVTIVFFVYARNSRLQIVYEKRNCFARLCDSFYIYIGKNFFGFYKILRSISRIVIFVYPCRVLNCQPYKACITFRLVLRNYSIKTLLRVIVVEKELSILYSGKRA